MSRSTTTLTELARLGFADLQRAADGVGQLPEGLLPVFALAADPDAALDGVLELFARAPGEMASVTADAEASARLVRVLGASRGLAEFLQRRPGELAALRDPLVEPLDEEGARLDLLRAVDGLRGDAARTALRVRYRHQLTRLAAWDLSHADPTAVVHRVAAGLADLAAAALGAALDLARRGSRFSQRDVMATRLAVIGMGKAGARELNYLSDVDVIYVAAAAVDDDGASMIPDDRAVEIATRLAMDTSRIIQDLDVEPGLWEVDANLRPEGRDGALVRTLDSHLAYYQRWARGWEFQALIKARPLAGDRELGERYVDAVRPLVYSSAAREGFVEQVQRMRERVTANVPSQELDHQLKLGPGGLRDIEFTIQLLQLVHGQHDDRVRQRDTLSALAGLAEHGYVGRVEASEFAADYRLLRVLEHRVQLRRLRRTHLMPRDDDGLRVLARAAGIAGGASGVQEAWQRTRHAVRRLHERLFYRPLLAAVAALPEDGWGLTSDQAAARLSAIGFLDPVGALRHLAALTAGVSRRAEIQRHLLPVLLPWFAEGADPDGGLLAFRRLSDDLGETSWFLRMLRDSSGAARRLTDVLSASRFVAVLLERIPEAAAWLENDSELRPRPLSALLEEAEATVARHRGDADAAASALRTARRREVLRLALGGILGLLDVEELGAGLSAVTTALLSGVVALAHRWGDGIEFGIIAMGRYGGEELGFGSDVDVMYVYRPAGATAEESQRTAEAIVREVGRLTEDLRLPFELDTGLRPEGRNGAIVRSLESYRAYYARWSLGWEAQALLRARGAVGDHDLLVAFERLADLIRYPESVSEADIREIKRIKARVEAERLPRGADPSRHLKLGRGSLSDVEWLVQLLQLTSGHRTSALRTTSTLRALAAAVEADSLTAADADRLRSAWLIASRSRSALVLWSAKTADSLPTDRRGLEGVARLLEYPPGGATALEEDYLRSTRLARQVFERLFYGPAASD